MSDKPQLHEHLYEAPIEVLGLSDVAIKAAKETGMTSVGDLIDFYIRGADNHVPPIPGLLLMFSEGETKMKTHGYWSFVERDPE